MKKNIIFIFLFFCICSCFLIHYPLALININPWNNIDLGNNSIPKNFNNETFSTYKNFVEINKTKISNTIKNQFPQYINILKFNSILNKDLNKKLYDIIFKEDYKFIPVFYNSNYNIFLEKNNKFIIRIENLPNYHDKIKTTTSIINYISNKYKDLNISVYIVPDLSSNNILNNTKRFIKKENLVDELVKNFNDNVNVDYLKYNSLEEYNNYFFKSDHHWNYNGAYQGYCDIIQLLKKTYPDIGKPLTFNNYRYADESIKFMGSLSRMTVNSDIYDIIFDGGIILPPYRVSINDGEYYDNIYRNKEIYFNGTTTKLDFFPQYADFFHGDYAQIHYEFNNDNKRNLLIIADSISDCMDDLIASHFYNTYVIDLRAFSDFDFNTYINEKNITDVLFLNLGATMIDFLPNKEINFISHNKPI